MKPKESALVFGCASVILSYPEDGFTQDLESARGGLERLGRSQAKASLSSVLEWLSEMEVAQAAANYVETFDLQKKRSLHLTYYLYGDTRERGMALSSLMEAYKASGFTLGQGELPDFLPALLELAAASPLGREALSNHRVAMTLLHDELRKAKSPYEMAIAAVLNVVGGTSKTERATALQIKSRGPLYETVGLEPYGPQQAMVEKVEIR